MVSSKENSETVPEKDKIAYSPNQNGKESLFLLDHLGKASTKRSSRYSLKVSKMVNGKDRIVL
jgi:hypothetical protein